MQCVKCAIELDDVSWLPSRRKRNVHVCKFCIQKDNNYRYLKNKEKYLKNIKNNYKLLKQKVFDYYGGKCEICKQNNYDFLSLDHINGNGRKQRKELLSIDSGTSFYKYVFKNKPNDLRILCYNCNCKKKITYFHLQEKFKENCKFCNSNENVIYKICRSCKNKVKHNAKTNVKLQVLEQYGNSCNHCGENNQEFLTIDHINNDGAIHRKNTTNIYTFLKRNNFPKENFQILCYNCNYFKYFNI